MVSQWEFYKIAQNSAVSIKNQAKSFLEDLLDRVLLFMKNSVWVPRHEFWLNLYYRSQWPKTTLKQNKITEYMAHFIPQRNLLTYRIIPNKGTTLIRAPP